MMTKQEAIQELEHILVLSVTNPRANEPSMQRKIEAIKMALNVLKQEVKQKQINMFDWRDTVPEGETGTERNERISKRLRHEI